jgi:hypothetical protein
MPRRYLIEVSMVTDPQGRNGHAGAFVGCILVVNHGHRGVLGRSTPAH